VSPKQVEGPSRGSYGLNVARLAGIPDHVLALAAKNATWMRSRRVATMTGQLATQNDMLGNGTETNSRKRKAEESLESGAEC